MKPLIIFWVMQGVGVWVGHQLITKHTHTYGKFGNSKKPQHVFGLWGTTKAFHKNPNAGKTCKPSNTGGDLNPSLRGTR